MQDTFARALGLKAKRDVRVFCMQDTFAYARTRQPLGPARATIGYLIYSFYASKKHEHVHGVHTDNLYARYLCSRDDRVSCKQVVYKIPYRRARLALRPLGRVRARAKISCIQVNKLIPPVKKR